MSVASTPVSPVGSPAGGHSIIGTSVEDKRPSTRSTTPSKVSPVSSHAGGHSLTGPPVEEIAAFGGIPDLMSGDTRVSQRIQTQPDADDLQLGRAMRAAKLRDLESTTGVSINTSFSILNFSDDEIVNNATKIGVSLGSNSMEVAKSVNDLLDLEAERAMHMLRNIASITPMRDSEVMS